MWYIQGEFLHIYGKYTVSNFVFLVKVLRSSIRNTVMSLKNITVNLKSHRYYPKKQTITLLFSLDGASVFLL